MWRPPLPILPWVRKLFVSDPEILSSLSTSMYCSRLNLQLANRVKSLILHMTILYCIILYYYIYYKRLQVPLGQAGCKITNINLRHSSGVLPLGYLLPLHSSGSELVTWFKSGNLLISHDYLIMIQVRVLFVGPRTPACTDTRRI